MPAARAEDMDPAGGSVAAPAQQSAEADLVKVELVMPGDDSMTSLVRRRVLVAEVCDHGHSASPPQADDSEASP